MTNFKYNWGWVFVSISIILLIFSIKKCGQKDIAIESPKQYVDSLLIENKALSRLAKEIERKRIEDSIKLTKEIDYYKRLKRKERIVYVAGKVGGSLINQDTLTCFNDKQLDSVGVISIERDYCYEDRDKVVKLNSIKDVQIANSNAALSKCLSYSESLEGRYESLRKDRDKQVKKKVFNRKVALVATVIAITEGVLLLLK